MNFDFLKNKEYYFLRSTPIKANLMLLTMGGSHAYGTNINTPEHTSDIDVRGIIFDSKEDLLLLKEPSQFCDEATDTVLYSFNKIVKLLISCNPNTIEMLGCRKEDYAYLHPLGQLLIDNRKAFLSQRALNSFGGYAYQQLSRLENALARDRLSQSKKEEHILNSVKSAMLTINERYSHCPEQSIRLYTDKSSKAGMDSEIYIDINLEHYPLRDLNGIWNEFVSIPRQYEKVNHRNRKKDDTHLNKHAMHLIRLYLMLIDILEEGDIITYREKDLDLLMSIRNGSFMNADGSYKAEFFELLESYKTKVEKLKRSTWLPKEPDYETIYRLIKKVNEYIISGR